MKTAERLRKLSDKFYKTDDEIAGELAIMSAEVQGLEFEVDRLNTAIEDQAEVAITKMAKLIDEVRVVKVVLYPFAKAHVAASPFESITLHDLRKAYDVLNPDG
jgi:hypothetical protein